MAEQDDHKDDHDGGLTADLSRMMTRRRVVTLIGLAGAGAVGYVALRGVPGQAEANLTGTGADGATCIKSPGETSGPFPGDGTNSIDGQTVNVLQESGILREDIRPSFGDMAGDADGVTVDLVLTVVDVGSGCAPLAGRAVYLWHCDVAGHYSLYDLPGQNYLRGVGLTDANGQVKFTTIFPGCYAGRWPHMHFEVFDSLDAATTGRASRLISQFAMPEDVCRAVYEGDARYGQSLANLARSNLSRDMVFRDNTAEQLAGQTLSLTGSTAAGFAATGSIGVAL